MDVFCEEPVQAAVDLYPGQSNAYVIFVLSADSDVGDGYLMSVRLKIDAADRYRHTKRISGKSLDQIYIKPSLIENDHGGKAKKRQRGCGDQYFFDNRAGFF